MEFLCSAYRVNRHADPRQWKTVATQMSGGLLPSDFRRAAGVTGPAYDVSRPRILVMCLFSQESPFEA